MNEEISRMPRRTFSGVLLLTILLSATVACSSKGKTMDSVGLKEFAKKYTAAWCSQNAASVASFFANNGSLKINDGPAAIGRAAITASVQGFMTAFPDLVVKMDAASLDGDQAIYRWTLTGTNTGPGGTGRSVRISGYEEWTLGRDGLVAASKGHFDAADYQRQLQPGSGGS